MLILNMTVITEDSFGVKQKTTYSPLMGLVLSILIVPFLFKRFRSERCFGGFGGVRRDIA
jgi:hypothetical protein